MSGAMVLCWKRVGCSLQVTGEVLPMVWKSLSALGFYSRGIEKIGSSVSSSVSVAVCGGKQEPVYVSVLT